MTLSDEKSQSRITVRLPPESLEKIERLIAEGKFKNLSDFIRQAIDSFLEELAHEGPAQKVSVRLSRSEMTQIINAIENGEAVDEEDLIRIAVREYIRRRLREIQNENLRKDAGDEGFQ
jgi:Ribbon-helix-helix protein, copG family.